MSDDWLKDWNPVPRKEAKGTGPMTWEQRVDNAIRRQIRVANGEKVPTSKKGVYLKSWRNENDEGRTVPKISNAILFPNNDFNLSEDQYKNFLEWLKDWRSNPNLVNQIQECNQRRLKAAEEREAKKNK